jgi:hypothetical protein
MVFAPYSYSTTLSPHPLPSHWFHPPQAGPVLPSYSSDFIKEEKTFLFKIAIQEVPL